MLSHDESALAALPSRTGLEPINLNELDLPERLRGQDLAETRFFLTDRLETTDSTWLGVVRARWQEKWPAWPQLADLPALASRLQDPRMVIAPAVWWWPTRDVARFAARQDRRYPGMGALLTIRGTGRSTGPQPGSGGAPLVG